MWGELRAIARNKNTTEAFPFKKETTEAMVLSALR